MLPRHVHLDIVRTLHIVPQDYRGSPATLKPTHTDHDKVCCASFFLWELQHISSSFYILHTLLLPRKVATSSICGMNQQQRLSFQSTGIPTHYACALHPIDALYCLTSTTTPNSTSARHHKHHPAGHPNGANRQLGCNNLTRRQPLCWVCV